MEFLEHPPLLAEDPSAELAKQTVRALELRKELESVHQRINELQQQVIQRNINAAPDALGEKRSG